MIKNSYLVAFIDTYGDKLNSVQEFVKIKSWLFLIFSICLHNQL